MYKFNLWLFNRQRLSTQETPVIFQDSRVFVSDWFSFPVWQRPARHTRPNKGAKSTLASVVAFNKISYRGSESESRVNSNFLCVVGERRGCLSQGPTFVEVLQRDNGSLCVRLGFPPVLVPNGYVVDFLLLNCYFSDLIHVNSIF